MPPAPPSRGSPTPSTTAPSSHPFTSADPSDGRMSLAEDEELRGRKLPALLLLLAFASVLLFPLLGRQGLTDPDESAYAASVREMAERNDWLVPHLYGE